MKHCRRRIVFAGIACALSQRPVERAHAGGLLLPGAGAVSTARAGASTAAADDGEAVVLNPAGVAKGEGTTVTLSAVAIEYAMEFQRRGTYDAVSGEQYPYANQPFALVKNDARPPLGVDAFQPIPVAAILSDLGGVLPHFRFGLGLYAPNSYPFRDMCTQIGGTCRKYKFNSDPNISPASNRYDVVKQEALILLPSFVVAYRALPQLDLGIRISAGRASIKQTTTIWGSLANFEEDVKKDDLVRIDAADDFVVGYGFGVTLRPTDYLELAAVYNSELDIHAKGTTTTQLGPGTTISGLPITIAPTPDARARCAPGGTMTALKTCLDFELPRSLQLGARYKVLNRAGRLVGDAEVDVNWENWGKHCTASELSNGTCTSPSDFRLVVDGDAQIASGTLQLKDSIVSHGLQDTYGIRAGGSVRLALGAPDAAGKPSTELILRGGLAYDTAAAKTGWLRSDFDGAARTTFAGGVALHVRQFEFSFGGAVIRETGLGNPNVGGGAEPCNPSGRTDDTCSGQTVHQGPDPVTPISDSATQPLSPVAQGDYKAHYVLLMAGVSAWF